MLIITSWYRMVPLGVSCRFNPDVGLSTLNRQVAAHLNEISRSQAGVAACKRNPERVARDLKSNMESSHVPSNQLGVGAYRRDCEAAIVEAQDAMIVLRLQCQILTKLKAAIDLKHSLTYRRIR